MFQLDDDGIEDDLDLTADGTEATGHDDAPSTDDERPGKRVLTLGGQRFEVEDPSLAESLQKAFDRQAGRLGSRLEATERENRELRAYLQSNRDDAPAAPTRRAADPADADEDRDPELPPLEIPDRDLLLTQPDVGMRLLTERIAQRERALLEHTRRQVQRVREESEAFSLASVRETARALQARDEASQAAVLAEQNSRLRWNAFYKGNPDLAKDRDVVEMVFQAAKAQLPAEMPVEVALDLVARKSREIIGRRGPTGTPAPKTLSGGGPRGGLSRTARDEDDAESPGLTGLINRSHERFSSSRLPGKPSA